MMMQEQQMHLDPGIPPAVVPITENPPFTPPPPAVSAAVAGLHNHQHNPIHGFKMEPPHIEPLRLHNGHGGPGGSPTPSPGPPPPPWAPGGQTMTENTASFLNSAANPPPPPPSSGHSPNSILEVTSTMGGVGPTGGAPGSPGSAASGNSANGGGSNGSKKSSSRRNAWGNLSYADLITQAIQSSPEGRLTLSQVYEWMVQNIPYFKDKGDSNSSAGWKVGKKQRPKFWTYSA